MPQQLIEVSGKTQDECMVALHDCNEDVNRAINFLLESTSDTVSIHIIPNSHVRLSNGSVSFQHCINGTH